MPIPSPPQGAMRGKMRGIRHDVDARRPRYRRHEGRAGILHHALDLALIVPLSASGKVSLNRFPSTPRKLPATKRSRPFPFAKRSMVSWLWKFAKMTARSFSVWQAVTDPVVRRVAVEVRTVPGAARLDGPRPVPTDESCILAGSYLHGEPLPRSECWRSCRIGCGKRILAHGR